MPSIAVDVKVPRPLEQRAAQSGAVAALLVVTSLLSVAALVTSIVAITQGGDDDDDGGASSPPPLFSPPPSSSSSSARKPVIIDTDMDIDDMQAIQYALMSPAYQIVAISVTSTGWSSQWSGVQNAMRLIQQFGRGGVECSGSDAGEELSVVHDVIVVGAGTRAEAV